MLASLHIPPNQVILSADHDYAVCIAEESSRNEFVVLAQHPPTLECVLRQADKQLGKEVHALGS